MPDIQLPDALDHVRAQLRAAAERQQHTSQSRKRRWVPARPLMLGAVVLVAAGTATAAVLAPSGTRDLDAAAAPSTPAAQSLQALWSTFGSGGAGAVRTPLSGDMVKGLTVTRDGISAEVATDGQQVCFADHPTGEPLGGSGCTNLPVSATQIPYLIGDDETRIWLVAIVPDGVTGLEATGADGTIDTARVENNVGIIILPPGEIRELRWTTPNGDTVQQVPFKEAKVTPHTP